MWRFLSQSSREEDDGLIQNKKEMEGTETIESQEQLKEEENIKWKGKERNGKNVRSMPLQG